MSSKNYLKTLFTLIGIILILAVGYVIYFAKHYPLPVTSRISLDAKLKFVREHIDVNKIDTIIVGSSIGLNDIQGALNGIVMNSEMFGNMTRKHARALACQRQ